MRFALALAVAGCAEQPSPTQTITHSETVVVVNHITVTTTTTITETRPAAPTPCELHTEGTICTYVGIPHQSGFAAEGLDRLASPLYLPADVTWNPADDQLYVADFENNRVRSVRPDGTVVTDAGTGFLGDGVYDPATAAWTDGPALSFAFDTPANVAFDPTDPSAVYIAAFKNSQIMALRDGWVSTVAGTGGRSYGAGDPDGDGVFLAADAIFNLVSAVAFDPAGTLYLTDVANQVIRAVARDGTISQVAGTLFTAGYSGDGGDALTATLHNQTGRTAIPGGRVVYHDGALFVADTANDVIRRIDLATHVITTVAGTYVQGPVGLDTDGDGDYDIFNGEGAFAGDGGQAVGARLSAPEDVAFGPDGTMYIADTQNQCVRSVDPDGIIDTFAGQCTLTTPPNGDLGDGLDRREGTLNNPTGVEVDGAGNVYIADQYDHVIRVVWGPAPGDP